MGVCTNYAVDNQPLFAADITLQAVNFPGATQANGGVAIFIPTNYDAVYPAGPNVYSTAAAITIPQAYFSLRVNTPVGGTLAALTVTLTVVPVTNRPNWQTPGNPQNVPVPGISF